MDNTKKDFSNDQARFPRSAYANFQIVGRLGSTPEKQYTAKGSLKTQLVVSFNRVQKKEDGTYEKQTKWFYIDVFLANVAQTCTEHLKKGDLVTVFGSLDKRSISTEGTNSQDKISLVASDVVLLHRKKEVSASENEEEDSDSIPF